MKKITALLLLGIPSLLSAAPIHEAAKRCEVKKVAAFIEKKVNLNTKDSKGWTPLMYAAWAPPLNSFDVWAAREKAQKAIGVEDGCFETLILLINAGADVNARANDDTTALYLAMNNTIQFVRALIEAKADPRIGPFELGVQAEGKIDSPLMWAAGHHTDDSAGGLEAIRLLLKAGADPNEPHRFYRTPTYLAVLWARKMALKILIEGGADVNPKDYSLLKVAKEQCALKGCEIPSLRDFEKERNLREIVEILKAAGAKEY